MQLELGQLEALNNVIEGCAILDTDCHFVFVNETIVKRHGRTREETLGRTMLELTRQDHDSRPRWHHPLNE